MPAGGGDSYAGGFPATPQYKTFWAQNAKDTAYYQVPAQLLYIGVKCTIWGETASGVDPYTAQKMANAYDNTIYPKMMNTFGFRGNITYGGIVVARDTMELADWMGDGDKKLCILLLDIKDDYQKGVNESYVAGYFWSGNFFQNVSTDDLFMYSNETDMIYLDTYPGVPGSNESNASFAHEMQHLMNFVTSSLFRYSGSTVNLMDKWIDEGLSSAAEWVYSGIHPEVRWKWYNNNDSTTYFNGARGLISSGNNFFVWDNHRENQYAVLDDYATVYLFFQWLRLQAGTSDIYKNIEVSNYHDYQAVTNLANSFMPGQGYSNWETLLKTWLAANYINAAAGKYGYMNDPTLKNIRANTAAAGTTSLALYPGEGAYSIPNGFSMPGYSSASTIKYAGLNRNTFTLSDSSTFNGGALLTYNSNNNNSGTAANGTTTGAAASVEITTLPAARFMAPQYSGPFPVGAGDVLRKNGYEETTGLGLTLPAAGILDHE